MIDINLLPEANRKKESKFKSIDFSGLKLNKVDIKKIPIMGIVGMSFGVLVLFHLVLFLVGTSSKSSVNALTKRKAVLAPKKAEADIMKNDLALINRKMGAIDALMVKRFSWAQKLNSLSEAVTPGVWFVELSYDEKVGEKIVSVARQTNGKSAKGPSRSVAEKIVNRYLILSGYASSMGEQGTALIGKFIKSLKDNSQFYSDFSEIKLDSIKSDKYLDQEVMNFKITCLFKEDEDPKH